MDILGYVYNRVPEDSSVRVCSDMETALPSTEKVESLIGEKYCFGPKSVHVHGTRVCGTVWLYWGSWHYLRNLCSSLQHTIEMVLGLQYNKWTKFNTKPFWIN